MSKTTKVFIDFLRDIPIKANSETISWRYPPVVRLSPSAENHLRLFTASDNDVFGMLHVIDYTGRRNNKKRIILRVFQQDEPNAKKPHQNTHDSFYPQAIATDIV